MEGHCWKDRLHCVGASSSPNTTQWDQDDPVRSAKEFSVLRREARWHLFNLDFAGPGDDQVSGRTHVLPALVLSHPRALVDVRENLLLGGSQGVT